MKPHCIFLIPFPDSQSDYNIERSRKRKDYFTGCLPWPQKGTASFIADTASTTASVTLKHTLDGNSLTESIYGSMNGTSKN
jgi:hypothetical protein